MLCRQQHRLSPYIYNCFHVSAPLRSSSPLHCTPLRSSSFDIILLSPLFVNTPPTPPSQPTGRPSFIPVRAQSFTCNDSQDASAVLPSLPTRRPVRRSTAATLASASSSERPRKRLAVGLNATTEASPVKRFRTDHPVTTVSSLTTPAAAAASGASLIWAPPHKIQSVPVQLFPHPPAAPSLGNIHGYPVKV